MITGQRSNLSPAPDVPQISTLKGIKNQIDDLRERAFNLAIHLDDLGNRAYGQEPEAANKGAPTAVPIGVVGEIQSAMSDLEAALVYAQDRAQRIGILA